MAENKLFFKEQLFSLRSHPRGLSYLLSQKSNYILPYSLLKNKATYQEIISYLKEEGLLKSLEALPTRLDMPSYLSVAAIFSKDTEKTAIAGYSQTMPFENDNEFLKTISKAIGEGLERYMLFHPEHSKVKTIPLTSSDKRLSVLDKVPTFLPEQIKMHDYLYSRERDSAKSFECIECCDIFTKKNSFIPLQYIFWRYRGKDEPSLYSPTTNGAGAHFKKEDAILSGLHEELQRDTFMLYWLSKKTPEKISISTVQNRESKRIITDLLSRDIKVSILYLTNEYDIPTFITVLEDERAHPRAVSMGAGTNAGQYEEAIKCSLKEAISVLSMNISNEIPLKDYTADYKPFKEINIGRFERISLWKGAWTKEALSFFLKGDELSLLEVEKKEIVATSTADLLYKVTATLRESFSSIYIYEVDSEILQKIGYSVVRVFIPEVIQLYLLEPLATLRSERLAKALGKNVSDLSIKDFNSLPHFFP